MQRAAHERPVNRLASPESWRESRIKVQMNHVVRQGGVLCCPAEKSLTSCDAAEHHLRQHHHVRLFVTKAPFALIATLQHRSHLVRPSPR